MVRGNDYRPVLGCGLDDVAHILQRPDGTGDF
jgi:hypothetical protein